MIYKIYDYYNYSIMSYTHILQFGEIIDRKILFIDLETTGLVKDKGANIEQENKFPIYTSNEYDNARIVQLSWLYMKKFNYNYKIIPEKIYDRIVKPNNYEITNYEFHGITNEYALSHGKRIERVLNKIKLKILECDYIIGYNIYFDINVLLSELNRLNMINIIDKIKKLKKEEKILCIGELSALYAKPNKWKKFYKYQIPKQVDVYETLFNKKLDNAHNSKYDVCAMVKILYEIFKKEQCINIKDALKDYYENKYTDNDYEVYLKMKRYKCYDFFPFLIIGNNNKFTINFSSPYYINLKTEIIYKENGYDYGKDQNIKIKNIYFEDELIYNEYINKVEKHIINMCYDRKNDTINIICELYEDEYYETINKIKEMIKKSHNYDYDDEIFCCKSCLSMVNNTNDEDICRKCYIEGLKYTVITKQNNYKCIAYNLFYGEDENQIKYINDNNYDILFLTEASETVIKKFTNYIGDEIDSHCGYTYLGVNKQHKIEILNIIKLVGIIIFHVNINDNELVIGCLHLAPFKDNINIRKEQIKKIYEILNELELLKLPIILGGDTNMRDEEDNIIKEYDFEDVFLNKSNNNYYTTYPNREFKDDRITFVPKNNFRYDRFFIKNCQATEYKTIPNNNSDHLAISTIITF